FVQLQARAAERVGLDDVAAGAEVAAVNTAHDVGVGVVPQLRARAVPEPRREQHRPVAAVAHEHLTAAHPLDDLPPPRLHDATPPAAATSALALTTARVESLA